MSTRRAARNVQPSDQTHEETEPGAADSNVLQSLPSQPLPHSATLILSTEHLDGYARVEYLDARAGTAATEEQQQIEIPKFVTLSDDYALARPRANALQLMDTSDEAYLALHKPMETLEQKAKDSERARLEAERKKLRVTLERLTKREAARGTNQNLLERDKERQQEIKETQELLKRYDELLAVTPPNEDSLSPAPSATHDDTDENVDSDKIKLRRRPRLASEPSRPSPASSSSSMTKPKPSRGKNAKADPASLIVDISTGSRPVSSTVPAAAGDVPPSKRVKRNDKGAQGVVEARHTGARQSQRLASISSAQSNSATSSPVAPPPSAQQQSFIEDSKLRLQLFPPARAVPANSEASQRRSSRHAPTHDIAFGEPTPTAALEARDFDLPSTWLATDAEEHGLEEVASRLRQPSLNGKQKPSTPIETRSSPRARGKDGPDVPDSQEAPALAAPSQDFVVAETEFTSSGQRIEAEADSDEAIEQELVPSARSNG